MNELYLGLISGTSADGIDAALVQFENDHPTLIAHHYSEYDDKIRQEILALYREGADELLRLGQLDVLLGHAFADCADQLLQKNNIQKDSVKAIGSHGQTIRHYPQLQYTLQIADPNIIAAKTGITTVADFRRRDMALGGQGAPLVPAFHRQVFASSQNNRVILNIGGIANVTLLPKKGKITGWDTGPGNTLLDSYCEYHLQERQDKGGQWAAQGKLNESLLEKMLQDAYFKLPEPKSTGREYFNMQWLNQHLKNENSIAPVDVQNTLVELTVQSIVLNVRKYFSEGEIFVCGGGVHNEYLMKRLREFAEPLSVQSTDELGVGADWVEAMAFAWFAKRALEKKVGNLIAVTGAAKEAILGGIYLGERV